MLNAKHLNINGLELDGTTPITPRTKQFLISKGINVEQSNGRITVTGGFSINKAEIDQFLDSKKDKPTPKP